MTLVDALNRLLGRTTTDPDAALYCPLRGGGKSEETRIAMASDEPDEWIDDKRIAVYECPVCGNRHMFLWGPPVPLYLGDVQKAGVEESAPGTDGGRA